MALVEQRTMILKTKKKKKKNLQASATVVNLASSEFGDVIGTRACCCQGSEKESDEVLHGCG